METKQYTRRDLLRIAGAAGVAVAVAPQVLTKRVLAQEAAMTRYLFYNPTDAHPFEEFKAMLGDRLVSPDGSRRAGVGLHVNPLGDKYTNADGTVNEAVLDRTMDQTFGLGTVVGAGFFAGKFDVSDLTASLAQNPDNLMRDQYLEPIPIGQYRGDTYFTFARHIPPSERYPNGKRNEFLDILERNLRAITQRFATRLDAEAHSRFVMKLLGGEMKYSRARSADGTPRWADYSEYALEWYRRYTQAWMRSTGKTWAEFCTLMGIPPTEFRDVWELMPPRLSESRAPEWNRLPSKRNPNTSAHFSHWYLYRLLEIREHIERNVRWFNKSGLPGPYWSSQAIGRQGWMMYWRAMDPATLDDPNVVPGVSLYGARTTDEVLLGKVRDYTQPYLAQNLGWASFQWNPWIEGQTFSSDHYLTAIRKGVAYGMQGFKVHGEFPDEHLDKALIEPSLLGDPDSACKRWMAGE